MNAACRCGRETRDDAYVCEDCCDELATALGDVAWLDGELETTITKQRGIPTGGTGGASADCSCSPADIDASRCKHSALPWHEKAAEVRDTLRAQLVSWVRFCDEEQVRHQSPASDLPADTLPALSRWLLWRVDGLALHELGPDAHDEITDTVAHCRRLIDKRPERWYAGPCDECGEDLYAKARRGAITCRTEECGATYDVGERRAWLLAEAEDRLATVGTIARAVTWLGAEPLTKHRVGMWAKRGRLVAKGHDGRHALYRIGDAINLLAEESVNMEAG